MRSRDELFPTALKIEVFLIDLAVGGNVAPATQNQAMNALVSLYKRVLNLPWRTASMPCAPRRRSTSPWS